MEVVLTSDSVEDFLEKLPVIKEIDFLLLDIGLPGISGLDGIQPIKKIKPELKIIMLTAFEDSEQIFQALCNGASSYITKKTSQINIRSAILTVNQGGAYMSPAIARKVIEYFSPKEKSKNDPLTPRQSQVVDGLCNGMSYKMIAGKHSISVETVRDHIKKIYKKLEINSKGELLRKRMDGDI